MKTASMKVGKTPCPDCGKRPELCICAGIRKLPTKHAVLFFQHPQEPDQDLGSARIAHLSLENSFLKIALSVPNLKKALGVEQAVPSEWGVLYLGSGIKGEPAGSRKPGLRVVSKSGGLLPEKAEKEILSGLKGIILLDGTWSQAKTLWWRNSWLLKCRRLVLIPRGRSLYRELRKEPRAECLSTIETTAEALDFLGEDPRVGKNLREIFSQLLMKYRASKGQRT